MYWLTKVMFQLHLIRSLWVRQHIDESVARLFCWTHLAALKTKTPLQIGYARVFTKEVHKLRMTSSSQARVSAYDFRDPGNPTRAEHFSHGGGVTLIQSQLLQLFTNAFNSMLTWLMRFWKADPHSWNRMGSWEAVSQSRCLWSYYIDILLVWKETWQLPWHLLGRRYLVIFQE